MRTLLNVFGLLALLVGGVWFFQGINVLLGSFMSGQPRWAIIGGIVFVGGLALLVFANRRRDGVNAPR